MTTTDVEALYAAERDRFAEDLAGLDDASWQTPSLCRGWTVRDLCAHLLMPYELGFGSFIVGIALARFNFDKFAYRWARIDRRTGAELTCLIAKTSVAGFAVPGAGVLAPLAHLANRMKAGGHDRYWFWGVAGIFTLSAIGSINGAAEKLTNLIDI